MRSSDFTTIASSSNKPVPPATGENLIGKQLRRAIQSGDQLTNRDVIAPLMVNARQNVTLIWRHDSFVLKTNGIAQAGGALGEDISVRGRNGAILRGRVTGPVSSPSVSNEENAPPLQLRRQ